MQTGAVAHVAAMTEETPGTAPEQQARAHAYGLLGALLARPPAAALLEGLSALELPADAHAQFADAWQVLKLAAQRALVTDVDDEYQALFIGIGRGEVVPYGSWYLTGFLMDKPLAALRAELAMLGFERQEDVKEPEDHAAALCETMALLIAAEHSLETQRRFFQSHLEPWMTSFFEDLRAAPSAAFYGAVAQFGAQLVDFESRYLTMAV